jgi:hypothetical protein
MVIASQTDRQAINIPFEDDSEIGKVVSDQSTDNNKKHRFKASIISTGRKHQFVHMT